jgi:isopentenyldiphosphate isomerase
MHSTAPSRFFQALDAPQQAALLAFAVQAEQPLPASLLPWRCGPWALGWLEPMRSAWLAGQLPACTLTSQGLLWDAAHWNMAQRSEALQSTLLAARAQGLLGGWRDERFSFWHSGCSTPEPAREALFAVERAGYRFLGMQSHAVHVNGFTPDGRLWCGRRALGKATDPGLLDNLTAGGLPTGEDVLGCLRRELAEEAGLFKLEEHALQAAGWVRTARMEAQGWHDEIVHVFNLSLAHGFVPHNQDGEVQAFLCLPPAQVLARMQLGEFTVDATQTLLQGLRYAVGV